MDIPFANQFNISETAILEPFKIGFPKRFEASISMYSEISIFKFRNKLLNKETNTFFNFMNCIFAR